MRSVLKAAVVGVLLLVGSARSAQAAGLEGLLDYIDHLSGPGPFIGAGLEASVLCDQGVWLRNCGKRQSKSGPPVNRWEVGPDASWFYGRLNDDLVYPPENAQANKRVNAQTVGAHGTYWLHRSFGITAKGTAVHFSGELVDNGDGGLWSNSFSLGPVLRLPLGAVALDFVPLAQFGLGPFDVNQFGAVSPELESESVKFAFHIGLTVLTILNCKSQIATRSLDAQIRDQGANSLPLIRSSFDDSRSGSERNCRIRSDSCVLTSVATSRRRCCPAVPASDARRSTVHPRAEWRQPEGPRRREAIN